MTKKAAICECFSWTLPLKKETGNLFKGKRAYGYRFSLMSRTDVQARRSSMCHHITMTKHVTHRKKPINPAQTLLCCQAFRSKASTSMVRRMPPEVNAITCVILTFCSFTLQVSCVVYMRYFSSFQRSSTDIRSSCIELIDVFP